MCEGDFPVHVETYQIDVCSRVCVCVYVGVGGGWTPFRSGNAVAILSPLPADEEKPIWAGGNAVS
jgi:hypothetical protein